MTEYTVPEISLKRRLAQNLRLQLLFFPVVSLLISAIIWIGTNNLAQLERVNAHASALTSVEELMETYEAQMVRALREIDLNIRLIQYAYQQNPNKNVLTTLGDKELLPSPFLFTVSLLDKTGNVIASNGVNDRDLGYRKTLAEEISTVEDRLRIHLHETSSGDNHQLLFARPLYNSNGAYEGLVVVGVDAAFFVSSYLNDKMGDNGLLGFIGTEEPFRVSQTGERLYTGPLTTDAFSSADTADSETPVELLSTPWDSVERYTASRHLYDFPLKIIVGLSRKEEMAAAMEHRNTYLWRAAGINVMFLAIIGLLWRMSYRLTLSHHREVQSRIEQAEQVEYQAFHDGLTGLANRSMFSKILSHSITQAKRNHRGLAVLFLDLDHFKQINDTLGHDTGDMLLIEVANRIRQCLRESDTVARLGGDEFILLLSEINDNASIDKVANKLVNALSEPFHILQHECRVTASIGIATYPNNGLDEQTLTKNADLAMYQAKREGKNTYQFYEHNLWNEALKQQSMQQGLQEAISKNQLQLFYQPKRRSKEGTVFGVKALIGWHHPQLGLLYPEQFLEAAEESGLIVPIGKWALKAACNQVIHWQQEGLGELTVALKLTAAQLYDPSLCNDIANIITDSGLPSERLEIEISETLFVSNAEKTMAVLKKLKSLGIRIVIDDFGNGYSSIAMLRELPADAVKIDQSFTSKINGSEPERTLTESLIQLGKALSVPVFAQEVEFGNNNVPVDDTFDQVQGYYGQTALSTEELLSLIQK